MKPHVKNYLNHFGYGDQDYISSEVSGLPAADCHHLVFRSHGGGDNVENVIALTRDEHMMAHTEPEYNEYLKRWLFNSAISFSLDNSSISDCFFVVSYKASKSF